MPNFRYRALTQSGELVSGIISAATAAEVAQRMDYLRLAPIAAIEEEGRGITRGSGFSVGRHARPEDVTTFTSDLSLLLKAGARLDDALDFLASDIDMGRLRSTVKKIRSSVLAGESFADSLACHPNLFPAIYLALVRVGEASGALDQMLEVLAAERARADALQRKLADALRYPAFILCAAACVLIFFLMFVLPQFAAVLRDFGAKIDPVAGMFLNISEFMTEHKNWLGTTAVVLLTAALVLARRPRVRAVVSLRVQRLPLIRAIAMSRRTALFCRNLGVLLAAAVPLTSTLRILADMMMSMGADSSFSRIGEQVRQGRKLSDTLGETAALPSMAVRMLRLGEETGQLPALAKRVAEFYEIKLQRNLDRLVAFVGPLAIIIISVIVGGLIVSVMTSLLSVSQLVG
jgi:general secretion pathway protein F